MNRTPALVLIALATASLLGACANKQAASPNPGCPDKEEAPLAGPKVSESSDEKRVQVVNAYCPIAGSHAVGDAKTTIASLTRDFDGKKVGFCCEECPPVWDKMTAQEKKDALAAVMTREKKDGMR